MKKEDLEKNVEKLLLKNPSFLLKENHKLAVWEYWSLFEGVRYGINKKNWLKNMTFPEKIIEEIEEQALYKN